MKEPIILFYSEPGECPVYLASDLEEEMGCYKALEEVKARDSQRYDKRHTKIKSELKYYKITIEQVPGD